MDPCYEASLSVVDGPAAGLVIPIHRPWGNLSIGSDPACSLVIPLPGVAAIQARLWIDDGGVTLCPNASSGLAVNGTPADGQRVLRHGDVLVLHGGGDASVTLEYRQPVRVKAVTATAVAVAGGNALELAPLDPAARLSRDFVPSTRLQRAVRDVLQAPSLAHTALGWRVAQARVAARRQWRMLRAAAQARFATGSTPVPVERGPRPATATMRQSWRVRLGAVARLIALKVRGDTRPALPALRVVGGTQHRPIPGARRLAAARTGNRLAILGVGIAVLMLGAVFFQPVLRGIRQALEVPEVAAATRAR